MDGSGADAGFVKRGGRVSKLVKTGGRMVDIAQNRLNLHNLTVKGGAKAESTHTWIRPCSKSIMRINSFIVVEFEAEISYYYYFFLIFNFFFIKIFCTFF